MSSKSNKKFEELSLTDLPKNLLQQQETIPWQGVHIQMNFTDLITAIKTSLKVDEKEKHFILAKIGLLLSKNFEREKVMVALSVRSAFDLYLQARKFEPGSEIVMMGINIPDMVQIMKEHGLVPIPVDYDLETMAPRSFDEIKNAITEKTKCVLFAYLFGVRFDITDFAIWCKDKNIDIIEDVAQSFCGVEKFTGSPHARMTLFSLGIIKVQTAIYGGVTVIRDDDELFQRMKQIQESYPQYTPQMLRKRCLAIVALYYFINTGRGNQAFMLAARLLGKEREEFYVSMSRGFKPGEEFITRFRFNPCAPLLHFIQQRIQDFDYKAYEENCRKYQLATDAFTKAGILVPGWKVRDRGYWLFPIAVPNKMLFIDYMLAKGINAYRGATQLRSIPAPEGRPVAENSKWLMDHIVYMPIHSGMNDKDFRESIDRTIECYHKLSDHLNQDGMPKPDAPKSVALLNRVKL